MSANWVEANALPVVCAFAVGVLVTDTVRDWQSFERTEALVARRVAAAIGGCMPREQLGAKAILVWREDGRLHCTKFEDFTYGRGMKRTATAVPVLSMPIAAGAQAVPEDVAP